jgi:hypothetical protein
MATQAALNFDICARKHKGNQESVAANPPSSHKARDRQRIYELALLRGDSGLTLKEVVSTLGIQIQSASARISELKADRQLVANGSRREKCAVLVPVYADSVRTLEQAMAVGHDEAVRFQERSVE